MDSEPDQIIFSGLSKGWQFVMIPAILTTTEGSGNGHTLTGAILIGAVVAVIIILFLVIKLLGAILRHPFISLILFALGGFAIFKFALVGIIGVGVLAAAGAGALWLNTGDGSWQFKKLVSKWKNPCWRWSAGVFHLCRLNARRQINFCLC